MVEKNKKAVISEYVGMVVELDLLLLDNMTCDHRLVEQIESDGIYVDIDKLKAHVDNVRIHLESGLLLQRDIEYVQYVHNDVKNMLDYVNYLQVKNARLQAGFKWSGIDELLELL